MSDSSIPPQSQWPKTYLLQVMERAVKEGCVRLPFRPLYGSHAERMAKSFQAALNRIRRRSDKQHASFIAPEYHLITTTWEAGPGTMLVTYSSLPDNLALPEITSLGEDEKRALEAPTVRQPPLAPEPEGGPPVIDPEALVDELLARHRSGG